MIYLIGLFCFLLVIGFFVTGSKQANAVSFAVISMIVLAALAFAGFGGYLLYIIFSPH